MRTNKTANWAIGLPYVQYIKNRKFNKGIGMSSFQAVFGKEAYNGLEIINLPYENKEKIKSLKDLYENISGMCYYFSTLLYLFLCVIIFYSAIYFYVLILIRREKEIYSKRICSRRRRSRRRRS